MQGRIIPAPAAGIIICLVAVGGCDTALSPQARQMLQAGADSLERGQYSETVGKMDAFLRDHGRSRGAARAYYIRGKARYGLKDLDAAKADLTEAADAKDGQVRAEAFSVLGDIAYEQDDMALAEHMYRASLNDAEIGAGVFGHACFRLGCVLQRQGRWSEADRQFNKVIYHLGGTDLAVRSSRRVHRKTWTIQAGAFREKSRAEADMRQLREISLPATTKPQAVDESLLFLVEVGRYPTYEQAAAQLDKVRKHRADAFVTVTR